MCGKSLLHLQCHFGLDTLACAGEGAAVTGVDFSPAAIKTAQELAEKASLPARFICSDIDDLPLVLDEQFDVSFTSIGAGLKLDFFHEFEALEDPVFPEMVKQESGLYSYPDMPVPLPILFLLRAHKE